MKEKPELKNRTTEPTEAQKNYEQLLRQYQAETDPEKKTKLKADVEKALAAKRNIK